MGFELDENLLTGLTLYGGVVLLAFWFAMVVWAYRDMRARSRDGLAQLLVALMVAILNVPGLFIYVLLRPRETLSEAYERSLEEEALLQEIEEKPSCPGCGQRVQMNWQACPSCHTRLKKVCHVCHNLLELPWTVCPYCASPQKTYLPEDEVINSSRHVQRLAPEAPNISEKWLSQRGRSDRGQQSTGTAREPQYIDDEFRP